MPAALDQGRCDENVIFHTTLGIILRDVSQVDQGSWTCFMSLTKMGTVIIKLRDRSWLVLKERERLLVQ